MIVGGWENSGLKVMYDDGLGVDFESYEVDPQYKVSREKSTSSVINRYYPGYPNEPWPLIYFRIGLKSQDYVFTKSIILTNLAIVYLSFGLFWFDLKHKIELLGLGATYVLSLIAVDFVSSDIIPSSSEFLWVEEFLAYSLSICVGTLIIVSIACYYDMIFAKEMLRFGSDLDSKRQERKIYLASLTGCSSEDWLDGNRLTMMHKYLTIKYVFFLFGTLFKPFIQN